ncbi:hypothetical protein O6H91_08G020700 [Diphasiastrum complanatum]|uniref:Uncharacterized protein n=1 Tax=Diphasiastrum complanatum TaxID=34168 RepID=A0ACC2CVI8_DIPCM|nr:hypothetical protein O6H91_08G020700 [Diphasiastrum complanatum]
MQNRFEWKFLSVGSLVLFASYVLPAGVCYVDAAKESVRTQLQEKTESVMASKSAVIIGDEEETEMEFSEEIKNLCSLYAGRKMLHRPCSAAVATRAWRSLVIYGIADYKDPTPNEEPPSVGHTP